MRTVTIILPSGYASAEEFAEDCGCELASTETLNEQAKEHPPYDNPCDPFASRDRLPPDVNEFCTARRVLEVLAKDLRCGFDDIESTLERRFWCELPRLATSSQRLDAIRAQFDPGEANSLVDHIARLVSPAGPKP